LLDVRCFQKVQYKFSLSTLPRTYNVGGQIVYVMEGHQDFNLKLSMRWMSRSKTHELFVGVAYQGKVDIVFRFIIECSSLIDFGP
jgi:hypothetical protein